MRKKQSAAARLAEVEAITGELALGYANLYALADAHEAQRKSVNAALQRLRDWHFASKKAKS